MSIQLTETDQKILDSYCILVEGLGEYLGEGYEIILHSLSSFDNSVIAICNGHHTGRKIGSCITNKALEMLDTSNSQPYYNSRSYFTKNKDGKPMKSTTIAIRGENKRIIGLLCINFYMEQPLISFINSLLSPIDTETGTAPADAFVSEVFTDSSAELVQELISSVREQVYRDATISVSNRNKTIIKILYDKGVFKFKNSVEIVAGSLHISKNTVYLHLRKFSPDK